MRYNIIKLSKKSVLLLSRITDKEGSVTIKNSKHWWAILIRGIVAVVFGFLAILATGFTLDLLLIFLGIYLLLDGLFAVIGSLTITDHKHWWTLLIEGLFSIAFGIVIFAWPNIYLLVLIYIVALWAIVTGIIEFLASITASWAVPGKVFLGITGVFSVILGILIFAYPGFSISAIVWLIGIYAIIIGLSLMIFSFKVKAIK